MPVCSDPTVLFIRPMDERKFQPGSGEGDFERAMRKETCETVEVETYVCVSTSVRTRKTLTPLTLPCVNDREIKVTTDHFKRSMQFKGSMQFFANKKVAKL